VTYTLTIRSSSTGCETSKPVIIDGFIAIFKKEYHLMEMVQMSFLDLSLMDVRNLEIFNRYGLKVYSHA
jgi:hypothetical protein